MDRRLELVRRGVGVFQPAVFLELGVKIDEVTASGVSSSEFVVTDDAAVGEAANRVSDGVEVFLWRRLVDEDAGRADRKQKPVRAITTPTTSATTGSIQCARVALED